jgi:superfamily I DNA/RNA helicase
MMYPMQVYARGGREALDKDPRIVVGTIHSVKGGEADVVYLFPDLSIAGGREWGVVGRGRESVRRLFYVGATRARETLVLCGASSAGTERVWA